MPADLTPDEISFFETGELPPGLAPAPVIDAPAPAPEPAPAAPAAAAPGTPATTPPPADAPAPAPGEPAPDRLTALETQLANIARMLGERNSAPEPAQPKAAPDPGPSEDEDPLGAMMHQLKTVNATVTELQTKLTQEQQNNLLKQQFEQFTGNVTRLKTEFEQTTPDFKDAYAHIRNLRTEDLRAAGAPESDIPKILLQDELQLAQAAIGRGKNPAEEMYGMARRYGYVPKAAAAAPAAPAPAPATKMQQLQQGAAAARQPDRAAPSDSESLTLDGLKDASNTDLNKLVHDDKLWSTIVGGRDSNDIF